MHDHRREAPGLGPVVAGRRRADESFAVVDPDAEVIRAVGTLRLGARSAETARSSADSRLDDPGGRPPLRGRVLRDPIGVVAAVTPFNDPLNLVAHKVGPALAAGNAVIVKPDIRTPVSALLLAEAVVLTAL